MIVTNGQEYSFFIKNVLFGRDSDWFEDFKRMLSDEGINVIGVTIDPASNSHFVTRIDGSLVNIPVLGLYAVGEDAYCLMSSTRDISCIPDDIHIEQINTIWWDCCERNCVDLSEYCGAGAYISVKLTEGVLYNHAIRTAECRAEVADAVFRISRKHPRRVYCSSAPSYNIVMEMEDYLSANIDAKTDDLTSEIRKIAERHVGSMSRGYSLDNCLSVNFYHPKMPEYNGYGLARED